MRLPDPTKPVEQQDVDVLAKINMWSEARGEGSEACEAVMHVVMNRVQLQGYMGKTVKEVILHPFSFSWLNPGSIVKDHALRPLNYDSEATWQMVSDAYDAVKGGAADITNGSTHYFSVDIKAPAWALARGTVFKVQIGNIRFYRAA